MRPWHSLTSPPSPPPVPAKGTCRHVAFFPTRDRSYPPRRSSEAGAPRLASAERKTEKCRGRSGRWAWRAWRRVGCGLLGCDGIAWVVWCSVGHVRVSEMKRPVDHCDFILYTSPYLGDLGEAPEAQAHDAVPRRLRELLVLVHGLPEVHTVHLLSDTTRSVGECGRGVGALTTIGIGGACIDSVYYLPDTPRCPASRYPSSPPPRRRRSQSQTAGAGSRRRPPSRRRRSRSRPESCRHAILCPIV